MTPPHAHVRHPLLLAVLPLALALSTLVVPAHAADLPPTTLTLSAPATGKARLSVPFTATLTDQGGAPVVGARVTVTRTGPTQAVAGSATTDSAGHVVVSSAIPTGTSTWQATFAGDTSRAPSVSQVISVVGKRYSSKLQLTGPKRVVDERKARLSMLWTASDGTPVSSTVTVYRKLGRGSWTVYRRARTSSAGRYALTVTPRVDSSWRALGTSNAWWLLPDNSDVLAIDNVPAVRPVALPSRAPRPAHTPLQARATGAGAHAVITTIPARVWRTMVGRSWHRGCPVGRSGLRLLRINYWGFDGYRRRGEMVLSAAVASRAAGALRDMYHGHYPIRRMYRVDRFGWSPRLHGANDYASMRADNTSGFNCRSVVNKPRVLSPHARGRAIDVNTWENPYRSATGLVPNTWWASHSHPLVAWRSGSHPVVRIWRAHGFRWTYGNLDSQHVDGRNAPLSGSFTG